MARFAIKTLEFDKVKAMVAAKAGTSLAKEYILGMQIASDFAEVKMLQEETAEAVRLFDEGKRFPLGGLYNISDAIKRAKIGGTLDEETLMQVGSSADAFGVLKMFLEKEHEMAPVLSEVSEGLTAFPRLVKQIDNAISEKGEVKDSASTKLGGLRTGIISAKNKVKSKLDSILHDQHNQKYFQESIVTMRGDRYVIPVKQEYKMNFPGVVHDQSGTGATLFIEPLEIVNLNNDIKRYLAEEKEEIERILKQLSANIGQEADTLTSSLEIATRLDAVAARGLLAMEQEAVRPMLVLDGGVKIEQGRHPLIDKDKVVPLDIALGDDFDTLLVTGPNTGGKTVALKTVGTFALMTQIGLFLPARNVKLPVFRAIYADIGDEQSIEQSLSTFSGHMTNLIRILKEVKPRDLVLIDEICAGTDPNEGAALAMAMLEHLHKNKVMTIVTTHYSELKTFAYGRTGMENASVEFNPDTLMPTYRLLMGVPGSSNAFNISKKLGLDAEIIEAAGQLLEQEHVHMEDVLQGLEGERRKYESSNREMDSLRYESEKLKNELQHQKKELDRRKTEMLRKAREQADDIYRSSRRESEAILKELRKFKADFDSKKLEEAAEKAKKKLSKQFSTEAPLPEGQVLTPETAKVGQTVFVSSLHKNGTVLEVSGKEATVSVGILKMNVPLKNCILVSQSSAPASTKSTYRKGYNHNMFVAKTNSAKREVDVRGLTTDEAIPKVDKAIDDALLAGIGEVRVIHGKGTGALRASLTAYLRTHGSVKTLKEAELSDGGSGVTIATL